MRPFDQAHPAVQMMLVDRGTPAATRDEQPRALRTLRKRRRALRVALAPAR